MIELSRAQVEYLKKEMSNSGLTYSHLREDLTDHICCDVEYEMQQGLSFDKAYELVKQKIGIDGLARIQHDTLYLIDKKYRFMKKTMKISGLIAPIILSFGALFKIQHWPGGGILIVLGFFILSFFFLPSAIYVSYKEVSNRSRKWFHIIAFIGTFLISLSFLLKILHWPGAALFMLIGIIFICLIFLPSFLISRLKEQGSQTPKYIIVLFVVGLIFYLIGFLFKMQHWPGAAKVYILGVILMFLIACPIYVYKNYKNKLYIQNSFIFLVIAISWFVVPTMLFSINVSPNILAPMLEDARSIEINKDFYKHKNEILVKKINNNELALNIKSKSDELLSYIQYLKAEMVKINPRGEILVDSINNIDYNGLSFFYEDINCKQVIELKDDTTYGLINRINDFNKFLDSKLVLPSIQDEQTKVLISALNSLSLLQLNVLEAEYHALYRLNKNTATNSSILAKQ